MITINFDKAKEIMQTISKSSRQGKKTFTKEEYEAMEKYSFLMDYLEKNGVDLKAANDFWRSWAKTRDRIVTQIKPWDTPGSTMAKTLITAKGEATTACRNCASCFGILFFFAIVKIAFLRL